MSLAATCEVISVMDINCTGYRRACDSLKFDLPLDKQDHIFLCRLVMLQKFFPLIKIHKHLLMETPTNLSKKLEDVIQNVVVFTREMNGEKSSNGNNPLPRWLTFKTARKVTRDEIHKQ